MEKGQVLAFANENVPFSFNSSPYAFPIYDGLTFVPMLFDKPSMDIFQADFCRPIRVQFNRVISMFGGIDVHEYVIKLVDFDRCTNPADPTTCEEVDKLDVSRCISASLPANTIFLSKAHFYGSTKETMDEMNIDGFRPTRDEHDSFIYFEPYSGTPFQAVFRIQMNVNAMIDPMQMSEYGEDLEPTGRKATRRLLPVFWIEQNITLSKDLMTRLEWVSFIQNIVGWVIIAIAIGLVILFIIIVELLARCSCKKYQHLPSYTVDQRAPR